MGVKPARYLGLPQLAYSRSQLALSRIRRAQEFREVCFSMCALLCAGPLTLLNGFSLPAMRQWEDFRAYLIFGRERTTSKASCYSYQISPIVRCCRGLSATLFGSRRSSPRFFKNLITSCPLLRGLHREGGAQGSIMGAHAYTHGVIHAYVKFDMPEITGVFQVGCFPQDPLQEICCLTVSGQRIVLSTSRKHLGLFLDTN